jgi:hypothetical protein
MASAANFVDTLDAEEKSYGFSRAVDDSALVSFLAAGTVLFASLVVGSSASLLLAGADTLIAAILRGFLLLGIWTLGAFIVAIVCAIAGIAFRDRHSARTAPL